MLVANLRALMSQPSRSAYLDKPELVSTYFAELLETIDDLLSRDKDASADAQSHDLYE